MTRSQINGAETGFLISLIALVPTGLNIFCLLLVGLAGGVCGYLAATAGEWLVRNQRRPRVRQIALGWLISVMAAETVAFWLFTGFRLGSPLAPFTAIVCALGAGLWLGRYAAAPLIQRRQLQLKTAELPVNHPDRMP